MTDPLTQPGCSPETLSYAQRRIREAVDVSSEGKPAEVPGKWEQKAPPETELLSYDSDAALTEEDFHLPRLFDPSQLAETDPEHTAPAANGRSTLLVPALAVAAIVGGFVIVLFGAPSLIAKYSGTGANSLSPHSAGLATETQASIATAKLSINESPRRNMGETIPLGVSVLGLNNGGLVVVHGLENGMTLSAGTSVDEDNWWLSTAELNDAVIQPPANFVGRKDLTVELRLGGSVLADQRILHVEWVKPAVRVSGAITTTDAAPTSQAISGLSPEQIGVFLKRGEDLIASGDLAAAQLVLRRAADAGAAPAALMLAGTYDPMILQKLRVHGFSPDVGQARFWYEKANQLGSKEAPGRLKMLATMRD
jgi:hypothetical protein